MRIADLVFAFPTIILAMVVAAALGPSLTNAVVALLFVNWPNYARVMRSLVLGARGQEYVIAGRLLGNGPFTSLGKDVLPNVSAPMLVLATLDFGNQILLLSGLSFLGLGATPPQAEWGLMVVGRRAELLRLVARHVPRARDLLCRRRVQLHRRHAAGRARPADRRRGAGDEPVTAGLEIRGLTLAFGRSQVLRGIDVDVPAGAITGLAGESGSGKTMTGLAVIGLQPAGGRLGGGIAFDDGAGQRVPDLLQLRPRAMNRLRGRSIAMVFQDPTASLHPMLSIGTQLTDHVRHHLGLSPSAARTRAAELLERVRVPSPEAALKRYPHQFSGGQLQRIAIAIAIACEPKVLIADEPTTALDVTVQAGVLRLLRELTDDLGLAVLLVTHDLGVMSAVADTVAVMRDGLVVEHGSRYQVIRDPQTAYAKELVESLPHTPPPGIGERDRRRRHDRASVGRGRHPSPTASRAEACSPPWTRSTSRSARARSSASSASPGCGKSTLARAVCGLEPLAGGRILLEGEPVEEARAAFARRAPAPHPDGVPEPLRVAEPAAPGGVADRGRPAGRPRGGAARRRSCWSRSGWTPRRRRSTRTSSPAVSGSASRSPARWRRDPTCSSATSRSPRSTRACRPGSRR